MSLPFLKRQQVAGLIISQRKADGTKEETHSDGNENQGLEAAADDILRAITSKDSKHFALALQNFLEISSNSSDESEEPSDEDANDFDSLNEKAARERR